MGKYGKWVTIDILIKNISGMSVSGFINGSDKFESVPYSQINDYGDLDLEVNESYEIEVTEWLAYDRGWI